MASLPRASPAALRAAVRDARSSHAICDVTDTLPPQDEASQALPRLYELNEATTKEFLPGTLLLTAAGEVRYVPGYHYTKYNIYTIYIFIRIIQYTQNPSYIRISVYTGSWGGRGGRRPLADGRRAADRTWCELGV